MGDTVTLPEMEQIQKRDFRLVTRTGNDLIKTITTTKEAEGHPEIIKEGLEAAVREYISIIVEKSSLNELISNDERYSFLGSLDVKSIFDSKKGSNESKKDPAAEKLIHLVEVTTKNQDKILKKLETIDRLDQVRLRIIRLIYLP